MKAISLKNGAKLRNGQLIFGRGNDMLTQRKLNSSTPEGLARTGSVAKRLTETQPVFGQKRREEKGGHPLLPNAQRPLDDLPLEKSFQGKGNVPTHPGMVTKPVADDRYRGKHDPQEGNRVLNEAANLGRIK